LEQKVKSVILWAIRGYQRVISPALPPSCRFVPSCSEYAWQAVDRYGALKGSWLAVRRLLRCHPFNPGGYDPVPWGVGRQRNSRGHVALEAGGL